MCDNLDLDENPYKKIYIMESPSDKDLLNGTTEGKALSEFLTICNIDYKYYLSVSIDCLKEAIGDIWQDILDSQDDHLYCWPIIHISCHGNKNGIGLTSKEFIKWIDLGNLLLKLYEVFELEVVNPIILSMSSCFGLHGIKIDSESEKSPFAFVLGHEEEIGWDDGLVAFSSFYHNYVNKNKNSVESLKCMNASIGMENHFKLFNSKDLFNFMSPYIKDTQK